MKRIISKDTATSLTMLIFVVIGISGVMMFFHFFDNYVKKMHEILGLIFVAVVFFHVFFNWKSMKKYFSKKVFLISSIIVIIVCLGFVATAPTGKSSKGIIIKSVLSAPIEDSIKVLGLDMDTVELKLKNSNIKYEKEATLTQIANSNNISPFKIVKIITE